MLQKSRTPIGIIGLGIIGTRIAACLRKAGFPVFVWNRSPKPEPNFVGSPAEIAKNCDLIQIFVADGAALFQVIGSMASVLGPQHTVLCHATVGPETTRQAAKMVQDLGSTFIDAPFTGSKVAAENGKLVYYLGGADAALEKVEPVLKASSKAIVRVGEIGQAATMKLVLNLLVAAQVQSLAEGVALLRADGVDPALLTDAMHDHALRNGIIEMKLPHLLSGEYEPHFSIKHMLKDVNLGNALAATLGVELPTAKVDGQLLAECNERGWGDLDFSALAKRYERSGDAPSPEVPAASSPQLPDATNQPS
jgi:3-hydroxyisobutyrate dehydrogenase-like beta-hydroxyacid dehydrogenase